MALWLCAFICGIELLGKDSPAARQRLAIGLTITSEARLAAKHAKSRRE